MKFISAMLLLQNHQNLPLPTTSEVPWTLSKGKCSATDMEMIFHSHANKTHFHKKGCALSLILKVRAFGTQKWPIGLGFFVH